MKYLLSLLCCILGILSCTTPDDGSYEFDLTTVYNQINFEKPLVGQESTYIHFEGSNFGSANSTVEYTGDTLIISLTSKNGNTFIFEERITNGSTVNNIAEPYIENHDLLKTSEWQVAGDSLKFVDGSTFLYWPGRSALPFMLSAGAPNHTTREWGTSSNSFETPFNILNIEINGFNHEEVIGTYDLIDTNIDGEGYEVLYNRPFGVIRSSVFGAEVLDGFGWDLRLGS